MNLLRTLGVVLSIFILQSCKTCYTCETECYECENKCVTCEQVFGGSSIEQEYCTGDGYTVEDLDLLVSQLDSMGWDCPTTYYAGVLFEDDCVVPSEYDSTVAKYTRLGLECVKASGAQTTASVCVTKRDGDGEVLQYEAIGYSCTED